MRMKLGIYIIGDLCYLLTNEVWQNLCDNQFDQEIHQTEVDGVPMYWHHTYYGDGCYDFHTSDYRISGAMNIPVDSGTIGIISVDILSTNATNRTFKDICESKDLLIVEIKRDFEPKWDDGTFYLGSVEIWTNDEENCEYEEEEEDYGN